MNPQATQLGSIQSLHASKPWGEQASRVRELLAKVNGEVRERGRS